MRDNAYVTDIISNPYRTNALAQNVGARVRTGGFPGIVFVKWVEHGRALATAIELELGLRVPLITSCMPKSERKVLAARLNKCDTEIPVVVATSVWATGIDIPNLKWVMRAGGGKAAIPQIQEAGRAGRLKAKGPNTCQIIDVVEPSQRWKSQQNVRHQLWVDEGYIKGKHFSPSKEMSGLLKNRDKELTKMLFSSSRERSENGILENDYSGGSIDSQMKQEMHASIWLCLLVLGLTFAICYWP